jgi:hypothetical protein
MSGYIKLFRSIENWEWYTDLPTFKLFTHCLIRANHKPKKWHGITIESGTFVTSYERLSRETGLSVRSVRTSLDKLKLTGEVTSHATNRFTLISVVKWADYQSQEDEDDKQNDTQPVTQTTNKRQTNDKQTTTNKNDKNEKNNNKDPIEVNNNAREAFSDYAGMSLTEAYIRIKQKPFTEPLTEEEKRIVREFDHAKEEDHEDEDHT